MRPEIEPFTLEQMHQIENGFFHQLPEYYTFVLTLNRTGARIGEIIALEDGDVDFQNGFISINKNLPVGMREEDAETPKTESSNREIQMSPQLTTALRIHIEKRGKSSRFLFTNSAGGPIDYSNFAKKGRKIRNPKSEIRKRPEARNPRRSQQPGPVTVGFVSDFVLRISDF